MRRKNSSTRGRRNSMSSFHFRSKIGVGRTALQTQVRWRSISDRGNRGCGERIHRLVEGGIRCHRSTSDLRSELGELLYRLKYGGDQSVIAEIVDAAKEFIDSWKAEFDVIVPVPI